MATFTNIFLLLRSVITLISNFNVFNVIMFLTVIIFVIILIMILKGKKWVVYSFFVFQIRNGIAYSLMNNEIFHILISLFPIIMLSLLLMTKKKEFQDGK